VESVPCVVKNSGLDAAAAAEFTRGTSQEPRQSRFEQEQTEATEEFLRYLCCLLFQPAFGSAKTTARTEVADGRWPRLWPAGDV